MAWIESHESLPNHPKTKRMCRLLKISPVTAVGHLHFLWWWAMNHAQDGILDRYNQDDIADACEWDGDAEQFFDALVSAGFIDKTDTGYSVHDWFDYAGKLIALRQKDAERKRNSRGKKAGSDGRPTDIQETTVGSLSESIRNPNPNPNPNLNLINAAVVKDPFVEILDAFCELHQKGDWNLRDNERKAIYGLVERSIPPEFVIKTMNQIYKKKTEEGDKITSFAFYFNQIVEAWDGEKKNEELKGRLKGVRSGRDQTSSRRSEESFVSKGRWDDTEIQMPKVSG